MVEETAYYNGGQIYHISSYIYGEVNDTAEAISVKYDGTTKKYYKELTDVSSIDIFSLSETGEVKVYYKGPELCKLESISFTEKVDMNSVDVAPEITTIMGFGVTNEYIDLFFSCPTSKQILGVSKYYNLPFPLEQDNDFDVNSEWRNNKTIYTEQHLPYVKGVERTMASIRFIDNIPTLFKVYKTRLFI